MEELGGRGGVFTLIAPARLKDRDGSPIRADRNG